MKSKKVMTGIALGAIVALFLIPRTRKMITDAVCSLTDSLKDAMAKAGENMMNTGEEVVGKN